MRCVFKLTNNKIGILMLFLFTTNVLAQTKKNKHFIDAYSKISIMLSQHNDTSLYFKKAVLHVENAYNEEFINEQIFSEIIKLYSGFSNGIIKSGNIQYAEMDKTLVMAQYATFKFMTDSLPITINGRSNKTVPFTYNYEDYAGQKDWSNTFVSTLMQTQKGNCHSLPYLYKMIMDELGQECHLALAPNHIYIKAKNQKVGWYNIELTCGDFPTDAWLMASGYIHLDAIRNGIYMRALSDKEAVSMTLVDLAQGYQAKFGIGDGNFMLQCCDTALKHFPNYINALLLKGEILTELYRQSPSDTKLEELTALYTTIHELGYRKMPNEMYTKWLGSLNKDNTDQRMKSIIIKN